MHKFEELKIWQKSMSLAESIYKLTDKFPSEEKFNLTSQMRRCSVSIPSNIAEGAGRNSKKEFAHFLAISNGSSSELHTQILLSQRFKFITEQESKNTIDIINEIQKMNYVLRRKLLEA